MCFPLGVTPLEGVTRGGSPPSRRTLLVTPLYLLCCSPYDGKWSKSMIGYGAEDSHFVLELTYNYGIDSYQLGNDFQVQYMSVCMCSHFMWQLYRDSSWCC